MVGVEKRMRFRRGARRLVLHAAPLPAEALYVESRVVGLELLADGEARQAHEIAWPPDGERQRDEHGREKYGRGPGARRHRPRAQTVPLQTQKRALGS